MKQVYVARDAVEAYLLAEILDSAGIKARVQGEHISTLQGAVPFGTGTSPSVWVVDDSDWDEAQKYIAQIRHDRQPAGPIDVWVCPQCGETSEPQFTACWRCGAERSGAPSQPARQHALASTEEQLETANDERISEINQPILAATHRTTSELWLETGVVLILAVLAPFYSAVASLIWWGGSRFPFLEDQSGLTVYAMQAAIPVLYLIWRSGESWATFGLSRPRLLKDGLAGFLIWLAQVTAWSTAWFMIARLVGDAAVEAMHNRSRKMFTAPVGAEYLLLPFSSCAIGFGEELIMRGYLIPRFERLLGSSMKAVLLSTVLFASYHIYQGPAGAISAAVTGLVYGVAFCWFRRLWPIALAHAMWDFIAAIRAT